jgi:hypothetical protein
LGGFKDFLLIHSNQYKAIKPRYPPTAKSYQQGNKSKKLTLNRHTHDFLIGGNQLVTDGDNRLQG